MARFLLVLLSFLAAATVATGCGDEEPASKAPSPEATRAALKGSPAPLAAVHAQANEILGGGAAAFEKRLAELKGYPVVVNKWGSWCGPCVEEFPTFQRQAVKHGKRVAFLGVDAEEPPAEGRELLEQFPVSYPSYSDPRLNISAIFKGLVTPVTAFYDSEGKVAYLHQGPYLDERDLDADIRRYAR
jgi:cytochrome c biogenesis protein CcmG/thiol:disulfide interchange protein DsbE